MSLQLIDGTVFLVTPETATTDASAVLCGPITDDYRCPAGLEDEWQDLLRRWEEEIADGEAEIEMLADFYYSTLEGLRL